MSATRSGEYGWCALLKTMNRPRVRKELSSSGSGRMQKGTAIVAKVGMAACNSRAVLHVCADSSVTGYHRYHGEERLGDCPSHRKSVSDVSVRKHTLPIAEGIVARARLVRTMPTGCTRTYPHWVRDLSTPKGEIRPRGQGYSRPMMWYPGTRPRPNSGPICETATSA